MLVSSHRIGVESQPLCVIDGFAPDPDAVRAAAASASFAPGRHHYPGIRADLPPDYLTVQSPLIGEVIEQEFGRKGMVTLIDASFSIVANAPNTLTLPQRLPHCDAFDERRLALVHYLSPEGDGGGTAFFRHRSTGFETVDETRRDIYFGQLEAEMRHCGVPPSGYIAGDTPLFESIWWGEPRYNRALLYQSWNLHSGVIPADATLSSDPREGRLTVTMFLSVG